MKTIHLVRHGEGEHNVGGWLGLQIIDAPLTANGMKQCGALSNRTEKTIQSAVELIVSSPMRRTIQTTLNSFPHAIQRLGGPSKIVLLPQAREVYSFPCDVGTPRDQLVKYPGFQELDLSTITTDEWTRQFGEYAPDMASNAARARYIRRWLRSRPEQNIVLVAHGNAIRCLLHGYWADELVLYANCEARSYTFVSDESDEEAWLKEVAQEAKEGDKAPPSSGNPRL